MSKIYVVGVSLYLLVGIIFTQVLWIWLEREFPGFVKNISESKIAVAKVASVICWLPLNVSLLWTWWSQPANTDAMLSQSLLRKEQQ
jgi:hypothetical protein